MPKCLYWELKWAFLIVCLSSSIYSSVCKLFTFSYSSPESLGQLQPNLAKSILRWREFKFVQKKNHALFHVGDNGKMVKIPGTLTTFKYLFKTKWTNFNQFLGRKHTSVKRNSIQLCTNEGLFLAPRGMLVNSENLWHFKIFFRTTGPISTNLAQIILVQIKVNPFFQGNQDNTCNDFKATRLYNHSFA